MKKLAILLLLFSCEERPQNSESPKFQEGEVVKVSGESFVVYDTPYGGSKTYILHKVDCQSKDCYYRILENQITRP